MFKFQLGRPDAATMREAAANVGVEWDETTIVFEKNLVGFVDAADDADPAPLQDELEQLVGVRPTVQS